MKISKSQKVGTITLVGLLIVAFANAQSNKTEKTVQQVGEAVETLKGLFGKKKKTDDPTSSTTKEKIGTTPAKIAGNIYIAGKITDKTKYIDCDKLFPFNKGAAIVKKGNAYALIDKDANFIVPFHRYETIHHSKEHNVTGIFSGTKSDQNRTNVYINYQGKEIITSSTKEGLYFSENAFGDFLVAENENQSHTRTSVVILNAEGKRYDLTLDGIIGSAMGEKAQYAFTDSAIVYYSIENKRRLYGFKNIDGSGVSPQFDYLGSFSYGVAFFGKKNEFGEMRYGVINRKGKIVFPAQFSGYPRKFNNGTVVLQAGSQADFDSAIINTNGEILYKNTNESKNKYGSFYEFQGAFSFTGQYMLDKQGNIYNQVDFLKSIGLPIGEHNKFQSGYFYIPVWPFGGSDNYERFTVASGKGFMGNKEFNGLYNSATGKVLLCRLLSNSAGVNHLNWNGLDTYVFFDKYSDLAHVVLEGVEKDRYDKYIGIDGYINSNGEFAIIKTTKKSDW